MGMALEALIPFAAGHELIRQQRRDLELIGPISDMLFDQMIGAGCVRRVTAAWVGNVSAGLGHNYRRAVEQGVPRPLELEEHSNFSVGLALQAAALGVPYLPTRTLLGSDLARDNPRISPRRRGAAPRRGDRARRRHLARAARRREGHAHCWGNLGLVREAGLAARGVILVAEEIAPSEVLLSDPNRICYRRTAWWRWCTCRAGRIRRRCRASTAGTTRRSASTTRRRRAREGFLRVAARVGASSVAGPHRVPGNGWANGSRRCGPRGKGSRRRWITREHGLTTRRKS